MNEPIIDHVERLERSCRFWKRTSAILAALLLSVTISGVFMFGIAQQRTLRAAMEAEMRARAEAEVARARAEQALKAVQEQARPKE
jgi:hypothetical protein